MLTQWQQCFPGCEPIAHQLRATFSERWVRFHSLPNGQRYAAEESDYATILARYNTLLGELAQPGEVLTLLTTTCSDTSAPNLSTGPLELDPDAKHWRSVAMYERDPDFSEPFHWHIFLSQHFWVSGRFDKILRLVADDVLFNVMILPGDCRWLVHPYDGGMDVIVASAAEKSEMKSLHPEWLSSRIDGL